MTRLGKNLDFGVPDYAFPLTSDSLRHQNWRFDWYEFTLPPDILAADVIKFMEYEAGESGQIGRASNGYENCIEWLPFVRLMWGGYSGEYGCHVQILGGIECWLFANEFRKKWPEHRVSRADVCIDFIEPGGFDRAALMCSSICKRMGIQTRVHGDWVDAKRGRTLYCGSPKSSHMVRLYEKGYELRQKNMIPDADLDWFRLEIQVRPQKNAKSDAAFLTASEISLSSKWTKAISKAFGCFGDGLSLSTRRTDSKIVNSVAHMLNQYSKCLHDIVEGGFIPKKVLMQILSEIIDHGYFDPQKMGFYNAVRQNDQTESPLAGRVGHS